MKMKLPLGISSLKKIITESYHYVDKTRYVYELVNTGVYYFLSRPRRFGKTLFVDTLKEAFEGNKELFKGLYIYDKWNWDKPYPVISISFVEGEYRSRQNLDKRIFDILRTNQEKLGVECRETEDVPSCFIELIRKAKEKYGQDVVILIDEYDKPILDALQNIELAKEMREGLKNLYSVIKGQDANIKFVFMTGVSKFSKVSLFSGLNNLEDITINRKYSSICGYTEEDLQGVFA
ncbi:MAG: AAA family ATPase, partial [Thermodesulfovibrionales bacterium]|nr:AAA family ATPase [Thermodesulfovibrionales bacterium]